jgi:hypothetical protein
MIVIALATSSRSRTDKLYAKLKKELSDPDALCASFQYPVYKAAKMLGWNGKFDHKGRKLVSTIYGAGEEYDKEQFVRKMEALLLGIRKKTVIVSDVKSKKQIDMLQSISGVKLIVCGDSRGKEDDLINVYAGDDDIGSIVKKIVNKIREIT